MRPHSACLETSLVARAAAIVTEQSVDGRCAIRRSLRLSASAYTSDNVTPARVLNMSEAGVLIETVLDLQVDETLHVDLPEASATQARVVWRKGLLAGCKFVDVLPTSAVSAARLVSPTEAGEETVSVAAVDGDVPITRSYGAFPERSAETALVIFTWIIALLAVLIFVAAILDIAAEAGT